MATYSLKKSYLLKDLKETSFKDLWGDHGVFTTMWIFNKPAKEIREALYFDDLPPPFIYLDFFISYLLN